VAAVAAAAVAAARFFAPKFGTARWMGQGDLSSCDYRGASTCRKCAVVVGLRIDHECAVNEYIAPVPTHYRLRVVG
jgi:hypothetical protein